MSRSGSVNPTTDASSTSNGSRRTGRSATRVRLVVAAAVLAAAWMLASGAIRVASESVPDAIQLGKVPAGAVPTDRAGLHLVGPRKLELVTRSRSARGVAPATSDGRSSVGGAPITTIPGSDSGPTPPRNGSGPTTTTTPTLPGISNPPATTLPGGIPSVTLPPVTTTPTTLPKITVPPLTVPIIVTIPKLPLLDLIG